MFHTNNLEHRLRALRALRLGGAAAHPPDDQNADYGACMLWIRRQGWMARVEPWMVAWVAEGRTAAVAS